MAPRDRSSRVKVRLANGSVVCYDHELLEVSPENYNPDANVTRIVSDVRRPMKLG
jgi:hypothetical protein